MSTPSHLACCPPAIASRHIMRGKLRAVLVVTSALMLSVIGGAQTTDSGDAMQRLKEMSLDELMDLEVTSVSKRPEKLLDAAAAIEVITADEIRRSGATTIAESLRLAPNLAVAQKGARSWGVTARGFNAELANKLLVLIDGRAVYTPLYSGVFWERQDYLLADLERIEVISGPGGTLWGANAVNGVINITSKSARDTQGLHVEAGAGSELRGFGGVRYGGQLGANAHYRIYGKYSDRADSVFGDGRSAGDSWDMEQAGFRVDATVAGGDQLTIQGDLYEGRFGLTSGGEAIQSGHNLLGRWSRTLDRDSALSFQLYYDRTHLDGPTPPLIFNGQVLAPGGPLADDLDTIDLDFHHSFRAGASHQLVWGLGYRFTHDVVENAPSLAFLPPRLNQDLFNAFIQDQISLHETVSLILGTKIEHNDFTQFEWEPNARLQWRVSENQQLWAALSRAVRMPSRIDRHVAQGAPPYFALLAGGPNFRSETVLAHELGYRTQLHAKLSGSVTFFYNDYQHLRSLDTTPGTTLPLVVANDLEGSTHGVELSFVYQATEWWRLQGGFNLLRENLRVRPGRYDFNNALNETVDPEHQLTVRSAFDLPGGWELDAAWRWVDELRMSNAGIAVMLPGYSELDLRLAWHPNDNLELSVVGQNLLDRQHAEYGFGGSPAQEIKRSFYAKATWRY